MDVKDVDDFKSELRKCTKAVGLIVVLLTNLLKPINAFTKDEISDIEEPGSEQDTDKL